MDKFNFFLPLSKVEKADDGSRIVTGYASTPTKDLDGEIVSLNAVKTALPAYMEWRNIRQMHQPIAVGVAKEAAVDEHGLYISAKIVDANAIKLLDEEVLKGFSIGGKKLSKKGDTITEIELIEISLVDRPANPDCRIDTVKCAKAVTFYAPELANMATEQEGEPGWFRKTIDRLLDLVEGGQPAGLAKREFSPKARETAAEGGDALPDGSFPIKSKQDLKNAVHAYGRAKDKEKAKAHIIARAKALDATDLLPADWEGSSKDEKKKAAAAVCDEAYRAAAWYDDEPAPTLDAVKAAAAVMDAAPLLCGLNIEDDETFKLGYRLEKGVYSIMDLTTAFGLIRDAQRKLVSEGFVEKDGDDHALASKLGMIAAELATVIATKAEHEGSEAQYMTDESDITSYLLQQGVLEMNARPDGDLLKRAAIAAHKAHMAKVSHHLRKAAKSNAAGMACVAKVANMHAAHLAACGKAADGSAVAFAHDKAQGHLEEAHGHFQESADHMEMAHNSLGKAVGGTPAPGANGTVEGNWGTGGVRGVGHANAAEGGGDWYDSHDAYDGMEAGEEPLDGKAATPGEGFISKREADLMAELAAEKMRSEMLAKAPGSPFKGRTMPTASAALSGGKPDAMELLQEGVGPVDANDQDSISRAAGRMIGNMINNRGTFAKSVFDPSFRGKAGLKAN